MGRTLKMKVSATHSALTLLSKLQAKYGEKLMFHQSGGCCDGSAPMCFKEGEFPLGDNDVKLGEIGVRLVGSEMCIRDRHKKHVDSYSVCND